MEKVLQVKKMGSCYLITLERGYVRIPAPLMWEFAVKTGDMLDTDAYFEDHAKEAYRYCLQKAVYHLERRDWAAKDLEKKLMDAGYPAAIAGKAMREMIDRGFVDDERYAKRYYMEHKGRYGLQRIRQALRQKGVSRDIVDALASEEDEEQALAAATQAAKKNLIKKACEDARKAKAQTLQMLARKGYAFDMAVKAYQQAVFQLEDEAAEEE